MSRTVVQLRVGVVEKAQWMELAFREGKSMSAWLRSLAADKVSAAPDVGELGRTVEPRVLAPRKRRPRGVAPGRVFPRAEVLPATVLTTPRDCPHGMAPNFWCSRCGRRI